MTSRWVFLSDFNGQPVIEFLNQRAPQYSWTALPWPADVSALRDFSGCVAWTLPQAVIDFEKADLTKQHITDYAQTLIQLAHSTSSVYVVQWYLPSILRRFGVADLHLEHGAANILASAQHLLWDQLRNQPGLFLLESSSWPTRTRGSVEDPRLWYMAKIPFTYEFLEIATEQISRALTASAVASSRPKVLIVDLDNTVWGGFCGEQPWHELKLGGHDAVGEAFQDVQKVLRKLKDRGILLAIASQNDLHSVEAVFNHHPDMILRWSDFSVIKVSWQNKAQKVLEICQELNIHPDAAVFIDDQKRERDLVRQSLPDVLAPEIPSNPLLFPQFLNDLPCFDSFALTAEDQQRTHMIAQNQQRQALRNSCNAAEWIRSLDTQLIAEPFQESHHPRALQLLNKTNQMNLQTRRLSSAELKTWLAEGTREAFLFCVNDRLGSLGYVGFCSVDTTADTMKVIDFVLSCRAFGRGIEMGMLSFLSQRAKEAKLSQIELAFVPTEKNKPTLMFLKSLGSQTKDNLWNVDPSEITLPSGISLLTRPELITVRK